MNMPFQQVFIIYLIIYFTCVLLEALYSHRNKKGFYDLKDSLVNFLLGVLTIFSRLLIKAAWLAGWLYLYQFSLFKIAPSVVSWLGLFLLNEFVYYWFHRFSHEHRLLWAIHVNHHSSEKLNFSTAARLPILSHIVHNLFWMPLVIIGFDPLMIFTVVNFGFLVGFLQHTQLGRKSPLDFIFNTPSNHRVHHASNPEYINKNYGNLLVIFDRMFGTYKSEDQKIPIKYGLTENIQTFNPIKVIFHEWIDMFKLKHQEPKELEPAKNLKEHSRPTRDVPLV